MPPPPRTVVPPSYEYSPWGVQPWPCPPPPPPAKMAPTSNQDAAQRLRQELLQRPKKVARRQQVAGLEAPSTTILVKPSQPAGGTASLDDNGDAACAEEFVIPDSLMPLQVGGAPLLPDMNINRPDGSVVDCLIPSRVGPHSVTCHWNSQQFHLYSALSAKEPACLLTGWAPLGAGFPRDRLRRAIKVPRPICDPFAPARRRPDAGRR